MFRISSELILALVGVILGYEFLDGWMAYAASKRRAAAAMPPKGRHCFPGFGAPYLRACRASLRSSLCSPPRLARPVKRKSLHAPQGTVDVGEGGILEQA